MDEFLELLKVIPVGGLTLASLVPLAVFLIFRGEIVPKKTVDAMRADRDIIIAAKNEEIEMLKEAYRMSEKARITSAAASEKEILELGRTTVHLLESIHEKAHSGGTHDVA